MGIELDVKSTVYLDSETIKSIIRDYLVEQGYQVKGDVIFNVESRLEGWPLYEHEVHYLHSAAVKVSNYTKE